MSMKAIPEEVAFTVDRSEDSLDIEALWRGIRVGHAWCAIEDGARILICDLKVEDRTSMPYPFAHRLLASIGVPCRTRSFRHMGIGRMLMHRLLSETRAAGIREIHGSVTRDDIDRTPYLLDWYRGLGFTVTDADQECIPNAAKKIIMAVGLP